MSQIVDRYVVLSSRPKGVPQAKHFSIEERTLDGPEIMQGFLVLDHLNRYHEAQAQLAEWVRDGKLAYQEHIPEGIDKAPAAIQMLYDGSNIGKLLVRV